MVSFSPLTEPIYIKDDGTFTIYVRVIKDRKYKNIDTGWVGSRDDLTKSGKIKTQSFLDDMNELCARYRERCNEHVDLVRGMDLATLVNWLQKNETSEFIDIVAFGLRHVEKLKDAGRGRTAKDYMTAINAMCRYTSTKMIPVSDINVAFLRGFEEWIRRNPLKQRKNAHMKRAPSHYLSSIRALHNLMKEEYNDEDAGIIRIPLSPFSKYKVPKPPVTRKRAVSAEIIKAIYDLPYSDVKSRHNTNRYNTAKDCAILSFCLMGANSADLYDMDASCLKDGKLTYKRMKTRGRRDDQAEIQVWIQPEIAGLMKKYKDPIGQKVFRFHLDYADLKIFNKAINVGLKTVGALDSIKVENLEFYSFRHSWATIAINKAGVDEYTVHSGLNHASQEMKVTRIYLDRDWSIINEANRKVLDFVFKPLPKK